MKHKGDTEKLKDGLGILMSAYDWQEAMKYAKFSFPDILEVIFAKEGFNDGDPWRLVVKLRDGRYGWLDAWCDYSGWGCQEGGESDICLTKEEALEKIDFKEENDPFYDEPCGICGVKRRDCSC